METNGLGIQSNYQKAPRAAFQPQAHINFGRPGAGELTLEQFKQALTEYKDKGSIPDDLKDAFNQYIEGSYMTYTNGADKDASDLYRNYLLKETEKGDAAQLDKLLAAGSGFHSYITTTYKDSTAAMLVNYIESVRRDGVDKVGLTPELAQKLYDPKNGFGITANDISLVKNSSDPLVRAALELARKLGLNATIRKTREDVINGHRSERTTGLPTQIINGILGERLARNESLLPTDGSMIISYDRNNRPVKALGFKISDTFIERTGGEKSPFKEQEGQEINYRQFFDKLVELQLKGDESADLDRNKLVTDTLTAIFEHYDSQINAQTNPEEKQRLRAEEKAVAHNLTGRGLISMEKCVPVISALREAGVQKEVTDRLAGDKLRELAKEAIAGFRFEVTHGNDAMDNNSSIAGLWNGTKDEGKIVLFDEHYRRDEKGLNGCIDDADMTKAQKDERSAITIEAALDSYTTARKGSIREVFEHAERQVLGEGKIVTKEKITASADDLGQAIKNAADSAEGKDLIKEQIKQLIGVRGINNESVKDVTKALHKLMAHIKGIDVSALEKKAFDKDKNKPLEEAVKTFAEAIASATTTDATGSDSVIEVATDAFFTALKAETEIPQNGSTDRVGFVTETEITNKLKPRSKENKEAIRQFFEGIRAEAPETDGLKRVLDLDRLDTFVKSNAKLREAAVDESNKSSFAEIEQAPQEAGPLVSLIYKRDDSDANKKDIAANLTGVLGLISKINGEESQVKVMNALIEDLYKNDNSISTAENKERKAEIQRNLLALVRDEVVISKGRDAVAVPFSTMADPNNLGALTSLLRQLEADTKDSLPQIQGQTRKDLMTAIGTRVEELSTHRADEYTRATEAIDSSLVTILDESQKLRNGFLDDLSSSIAKIKTPDKTKAQAELTAVKTEVANAQALIKEIVADLRKVPAGKTTIDQASVAAAKTAILAKLKAAKSAVRPQLLTKLEQAINSIGPKNVRQVEAKVTKANNSLNKISQSIAHSSRDLATAFATLKEIEADRPTPPASFTQAVDKASEVFNAIANEHKFGSWLDNVVLVSTEREKFLHTAYDIMSGRAEKLKGWYAGGFMSIYAPAEQAKASKSDMVELLKRTQEHAQADDPIDAFKKALSTQEDADSLRISKLFDGLVDKHRDAHEKPDLQVQHSKTIFGRIVAFVQNFIMNRNLLATTSSVGANRYYPDAIRKRIEASSGAAAMNKPAEAPKPAKPDVLAKASEEDKAKAEMN